MAAFDVVKRLAGIAAWAYGTFYLAPVKGPELFLRGMQRGEQRFAATKLREAKGHEKA